MSDADFAVQQTRLVAGAMLILIILAYPCSTKPIYNLLSSFDGNSQASKINSLNSENESEAEKLEAAISSYLSLEEAYLRGYMQGVLNNQGTSQDEKEVRAQESLTDLLDSVESRLVKRSRSIKHHEINGNEDEGQSLTLSGKSRGRARKRRHDTHPVYLGFGQEAAGAAYDTFASILEDEAGKRIEKGNRPHSSSNPVRFIG